MDVKVGDRVSTKSNYSFDPTLGTVKSVDGNYCEVAIDDGETWLYYANELEPIAVADSNGNVEHGNSFKVGDRMRAVVSSGGGAVTKDTVYTATKMRDDRVHFVNNEGHPDSWGAENFEPAPLAIREGHFYRTRDGRKVGPMRKWYHKDIDHPWEDGDTGDIYSDNGTSDYNEDIIAEWTDEPVAVGDSSNADIFDELEDWMANNPLPTTVTPTPTTGFTVPLDAPEFGGGLKVGDRVETHGDYSFDPNVGVITGIEGSLYIVYVDDEGDNWSYYESELRLVAEATSGKDTINRIPWMQQHEDTVTNSIADIRRRLEALEAKQPKRLSVGDHVELAMPARVSGFHKKKVHVAINGGSYTLPAAALKRAA